MTMLTEGIDFLNTELDANVGQSLTYSRGPVSASITGSVGQTTFETDTEFGVLKIESRDFLVKASRLSAFGEPRRGDKITESQGDDTVTHEVLDNPGVPAFSYCDFGRTRLRIHTKRITTT